MKRRVCEWELSYNEIYVKTTYNDITVYKDATKIEKHIDNYTWVYDSSPTDN